jgi:hypothetical protein
MKIKILLIVLIAFLFVPTIVAGSSERISQGDIVYVNDTVDISGVVPPYPYIAYWNGYDLYDTNASYIIDMPTQHSAYYNFTLDKSIFENRLGKWYKYDGTFERSANDLAFIVKPEILKNSTMRYSNGTLVNISEVVKQNTSMLDEYLVTPPIPIKHVSDYLIARGDGWNITTNETTNVWLFGATNQLLDFKSVNNVVNVSSDILQNFQPGEYTLMLQTIQNDSNSFTVKYDSETTSIKWFDPKLFVVHSENIYGYSPQVVKEKFNKIIPQAYDNFTSYHFTLQNPFVEIVSISEAYTPNETVDISGRYHYNTNISFIRVKGYTNVAPGTILTFVMDANRTPKNYLGTKKTLNIAYTNASGTFGGDERWFEATILFDKYNTALGDHFITAYTPLSDSTSTIKFILYDEPPNHYVPSKEVRYISGYYGSEEFVPTPTPIVKTVTVIQTVPVVQTITVPVTPSNEVVHAEQEKVINEAISTWIVRTVIGLIAIVSLIWILSLYYRRKDIEND